MGTVWILGAGFSKPLGGPLLQKLLSPESERDLRIRYPDKPQLQTLQIESARLLYWYGRSNKPSGPASVGPASFHGQGEDLWEDAEEYLDYLDTAAEGGAGSPAYDRLLQILSYGRIKTRLPDGAPILKLMTAAARRLLAAECCAFLEGVDSSSERWSPYQRWLRDLFDWGEDTVVTFNYDLVPETLAKSHERRGLFDYRTKAPGRSLLLKLHGSVNWTLQSTQPVDTNAGLQAALTCEDDQLAIAGPGPSKRKLSSAPFEWCWTQAVAALKKATAIVFVGYRFPPTDAEAREKLLGAIRDNKDTQYLPIHTVLGPDTSSDDSRRLRGLLEHALAGVRKPAVAGMHPELAASRWYSLEQQPLFAQDFFSVVTPKSIKSPHALRQDFVLNDSSNQGTG